MTKPPPMPIPKGPEVKETKETKLSKNDGLSKP